ncbi:Steroid Delta-isomerase [Nocardioides dokdonensis FR1436]|uniref:Steroid Delta-isomerase n=1 Tax=Nocardioides dokdonensis FR1436 TaxID=1300347 RepID=A0A1A9GHK1_9ACTN|nr:nuclear transport factor 2 family protein [Nocardioides dokdonensis]ANH36955.1 Steroid Delta-isomerase [Nocardioides dokdonensis FR1436]
MAASNERIREVVESYVSLVGDGTAAEIVDLFAEGATLEDPVGSAVRTTREELLEFYGMLEGLQQESRLVECRIAGSEAAFHFELRTITDGGTFTLGPIDVMRFDDDARITSMRAFWSDEDMTIS